MNKEEFIKILTSTAKMFNYRLEPEVIAMWYSLFKDEDINVFRQAMKNIFSTYTHMPMVAEVKAEMLKITDSTVTLNAEDEYKNLLEYVHKGGTYEYGERFFKTLPEITQKCIELVGKDYLMSASSNDFEFIRKDFIRYFNNYKSRYIDNARTDENQLKKISQFTEKFKMLGD